MVRRWTRVGLLVILTGLVAVPASAQVVQSIHVAAGLFIPRAFESRPADDVLRRNIAGEAIAVDPTLSDALSFDIKDFRGPTFLGEWNIAFGRHLEVGVGAGFYQKKVPTVYFDLVNSNGDEIEQSIQLRVVPITGIVRFLFGGPGAVQPYVGAGVSILNFRYTENGEFVDVADLTLFTDTFTTTGSPIGAVIVGGVRIPVRGDVFGVSAEGRYQIGEGKTGGLANGFLADKIDLSGAQVNFGLVVRF